MASLVCGVNNYDEPHQTRSRVSVPALTFVEAVAAALLFLAQVRERFIEFGARARRYLGGEVVNERPE